MSTGVSPTICTLIRCSLWLFWKTPSHRWLILAFAVSVGIAGICGYASYDRRRTVIEELKYRSQWNRKLQQAAIKGETDPELVLGRPLTKEEQSRARIQRLIAPLPTSLAYSGGNFNALFPPTPMAPLSAGVSDLWPDRFTITAHSQRQNLQREEIASPYQLEAGVWDATTVAVYLLPLIIIGLTYNCLSTDRDLGTLRLILANPVRCSHWADINIVTRSVIAASIMMPLALIPIVVAWNSQQLSRTAAAAGLWSLIVFTYGMFWMAAALLINSVRCSPQTAGLALMVLWTAIVSLVPGIVSRNAKEQQRVMSQQELITHERAFREQAEADGDALKEEYYRNHPEVNRPTRKEDQYNQTRWDAIRLDVDRRMQPLVSDYLGQLHRRWEWCLSSVLFSPALACKLALDDLCGTSFRHHVQFVKHASEFDKEFKSFFQPRMMSRTELTQKDYDIIPKYEQRHLGWDRDNSLLIRSFATLMAWSVVLFGWGYRRLQLDGGGV